MKKFIRALLIGALAGALLCGGALAAGGKDIGVQLNGEELVFTDAVPQVKDQRTFLPFRAVFEALGAEVRWSAEEPDRIVAVRDGKTVAMTLGSTLVTVTENGEETEMEMDVAPYVDPATNRTYVPVRFAAEALGVSVGWDQENYTAVIMDVDVLCDQVQAENSFTYLKSILHSADKYKEGVWDCEATGEANIVGELDGEDLGVAVTLEGGGTVQDGKSMDVSVTMWVDASDLVPVVTDLLAGEETDAVSKVQAAFLIKSLLGSLEQEGITASFRGDMEQGEVYLNLSSSLLAFVGLDTETWYSVELTGDVGDAGILEDMDDMLPVSAPAGAIAALPAGGDVESVFAAVSSMGDVNSVEAYQAKKTGLEALADESFVDVGDGRLVTEYMTDSVYLIIVVEPEEDGLAAWSIGAHISDEDTGAGLSLAAAVEGDVLTLQGQFEAEGMYMDLNMSSTYTPGETAPETVPPAEAQVMPLEELLGSVIGE